MPTRSTAGIALLMRVDDTAGRHIEIDRDVLRRSYAALMVMGRRLFALHRPVELHPEEALSMSFFEPGPGEVLFELEVVQDGHLRPSQEEDFGLLGLVQPVETAERALQLTAQSLLEIMRAYSFVLAAHEIDREPSDDHVDLRDAETGSRLRLSRLADGVLDGNRFDQSMREFLCGLTREGVGAVSLAAGGRLYGAQIQHMLLATDPVLSFVRGGDFDRCGVDDHVPHGAA